MAHSKRVYMIISFAAAWFIAVISQVTAYADQSEYGGKYLNWKVNGFSSCDVKGAPDGPHLVIRIRAKDRGNAIQIQDENLTTYDYIFGYRKNTKGKKIPILINKKLEESSNIDIPLKSAKFVQEIDTSSDRKISVPIFTKNGKYVLILGYGFNRSDEPDLGGVCIINYQSE
jgi:hypothetical protein